MKNSIAERIADFLKNFPPFFSLTYPELVSISSEIQVVHIEKNHVLFKIGDKTHPFFYVPISYKMIIFSRLFVIENTVFDREKHLFII